jgi:phenylacetyl-CoA:acceptor oxidoreductase
MQYSWGANVGLPLIREVAQNIRGHKGVMVNKETARSLGLQDGDPVVLHSPTGVTRGYAVLRSGLRPDTVVLIGQFDHWATPVAKEFEMPSLNSLTALSLSLTDATGSGSDITRVRLEKDAARQRRAG